MVIEKLLIRNYKIFNSLEIDFSDGVNIFVGANDAGKTTLLEALAIVTTGRINGIAFDQKQLRLSTFNKKASEGTHTSTTLRKGLYLLGAARGRWERMKRIRIDELNGKTRFFGVQINTHEHNL